MPATRHPKRQRSLAAATLTFALLGLVGFPATSQARGQTPASYGELQVTTVPSVASQVTVGGLMRNSSGLSGLQLPVGEHRLCFQEVGGYLAPPCRNVRITEGAVTSVTGTFRPAGTLYVRTEPEGVGGAITVGGVARDIGPVTVPLAEGAHQVCFEPAGGWTAPPCRDLQIIAGQTSTAVGTYVPVTAGPLPDEDGMPGLVDDRPGSDDDIIMPTAPSRVSATHGDERASVTWAAVDGSVTGYRLTSQPDGRIVEVGPSVDRAIVTGLTNGQRYRVEVRALVGDAAGPGALSNVVIPKPAPGPHGFVDVRDTDHFDAAVRWLRAEGVTQGVRPKHFVPGASVSRAQMAAFIWRLHDQPTTNRGHGFGDVSVRHGAGPAISWLLEQGITTGTDRAGTTFAPNVAVTRGQMATFLWRSAGRPAVSGDHGFSDVSPGSTHAVAIRWLASRGISNGQGDGSTFGPARPVTRGQMAAFLHRMASDPGAWDSVAHVPATVAF
jgi:hypothetical protein